MKGGNSPTGNRAELDWQINDRRLRFQSPVFDVYDSERQSHGRKHRFLYLDLADWVTIVPVLKIDGEEHLVLVRQFRHGVERQTIEFPAGVIAVDEPPEQAAKRELGEETGYVVDAVALLGVSYPNPALMNNRSYTFLARIAANTQAGPLQLDDNELLESLIVSRKQLVKLIEAGNFNNAMMLQAYLHYSLVAEAKEG